MSLFKLFGLTGSAPEPSGSESDIQTIRRIVGELEHLKPDRARHIAAFAFILSRVANADTKISKEETQAMEKVIMDWGHLPEEQAVLVVEIAKHQNILFGGTENFIVTREYNQNASREEKIELLHCLFAVSASDESISAAEEASIAQIAKELGFSHREMIAIRAQYRDKRAVFQDGKA
jgi:uncharacterized tellurite resistance protein B-like protein